MYLEHIIQEYPELINHFDQFRENDLLGNPSTFPYGDYGRFSPTTLRYIKTAADLMHEFGDLKNKHIVEIGGGYGGLCKVLSNLGFASYTFNCQENTSNPHSATPSARRKRIFGFFLISL